jgi:hypothetical protein
MDADVPRSTGSTPPKPGRPRRYANTAEKNRAYRLRQKQRVAALEARARQASAVPSALTEEGKPRTGKELLDALVASGFVGMWADRTDIGDSVEFARQLGREAEQCEES